MKFRKRSLGDAWAGKTFFFRLAAVAVLANLPLISVAAGSNDSDTAAARTEDLDWLINQISAHYVYLPTSGIDPKELLALYRPEAAAANNRSAWLHVLESGLAELHDDHATLHTNVPSSPQLVPSGADLWAKMDDGQAIITQVRPGSPAAAAGLRAGDEISAINDVPARAAVEAALPPTLTLEQAGNFTLRRLLAGVHDRVRILTLNHQRRVVLPPYQETSSDSPLSWRWLGEGIGYIRFNNSLGDYDTVSEFDQAAISLRGAKGLILDLRDTPSGGNTDVAKPILGRFIGQAGAYQRIVRLEHGKHQKPEVTLRRVPPRGPFTLKMPMVVLVDRWTGSMGEGVAVGLKALKRATIVGTRMAGLRGGTEDFTLPHTKVTVDFLAYEIDQVDGVPRQDFVPDVPVNLRDAAADLSDPILRTGEAQVRKKMSAAQ